MLSLQFCWCRTLNATDFLCEIKTFLYYCRVYHVHFFQNYDPAAIQYNRGVSKLPQPPMLLLSSIKVKHATLTSPEVY